MQSIGVRNSWDFLCILFHTESILGELILIKHFEKITETHLKDQAYRNIISKE